MTERILLSILSTFFYLAVQAQCEPCATANDQTFDFCYTEPELPDRCAQFRLEDQTFQYQNPARKKDPVLTLPLPETAGKPEIAYLADLSTDKQYKLSAEDVLFIERALVRRADIMAVNKWDIDQINSGFTITSSGLAYKVLTQGIGPRPEKGNQVSVHYTGYFDTGKKFDSSLDRGTEFKFTLGMSQVIKGWDEGVALMNMGSRYLFRIPAALAYGERGYPGAIPPNSTLYFDVRLIAAQ